MGKRFGGVFDVRGDRMRVFRPGEDKRADDVEIIEGIDHPECVRRFGTAFEQARREIELVREAMPGSSIRHPSSPASKRRCSYGSAINNFGVREVLDALVELAPPPGVREAIERPVLPEEEKFSGVVFKVQANMDPAHRDRIAFMRVCSGRFERGMRLKISRTGKDIRTGSAVSFLSQRRDLVEDAYPGDIVGIPNHGLLRLGDTLTEGEALQFTGLPFFAPEMFQAVEVADPLRAKQLRLGLMQLGEEGAIQVFRPQVGGTLLLGAVGTLQFEVVAHRFCVRSNRRR